MGTAGRAGGEQWCLLPRPIFAKLFMRCH
jgi:hypothetical protein